MRFYLVLLGGEERRSKQRWQYEKQLYPLWTFSNIFFIIVAFSIILSGTISILFLIKSSIPKQFNSFAPTSLPWIKDEEKCKRGDKVWSDNKCWDSQHNPNF